MKYSEPSKGLAQYGLSVNTQVTETAKKRAKQLLPDVKEFTIISVGYVKWIESSRVGIQFVTANPEDVRLSNGEEHIYSRSYASKLGKIEYQLPMALVSYQGTASRRKQSLVPWDTKGKRYVKLIDNDFSCFEKKVN